MVSGMMLWTERRRTCLAYSPGGHYAELMRALEGVTFADCFHVTYRSVREPDPKARRTYHLCHPRRSLLRLLVNTVQSLVVVLRERPELVISTGADVALPTLLWARLCGARIVFIETGGTLEPSLTGRFAYPFADLFIVQWPQKLARFPRAVLARGLLL